MADGEWTASQNGLPEDTIVAFSAGKSIDFLMVKKAGDYHALFTDGAVERINPVDGRPRPVPDPADKTKGYKVPTDLRDDSSADTKSASRYTGLMRLAVGCHFSRGVNAPFKSTYTCTHGIVKKATTEIVDGVPKPKDKYWVVEIRKAGSSGAGIYIAPITFNGKCLGSWSIRQYMPTADQIKVDPSLAGQEFSLAWAYGVGVKGVSLVVADMPAGAPWYDGYGWAFSASGAFAQIVLFRKLADNSNPGLGIPVGEAVLKTCRWKIAFTLSGTEFPTATLTAAIVQNETEKLIIFLVNGYQRLWIPSGGNQFTCSYPTTADLSAYTRAGDQDAPMHVHYNGETEVVVRWQRSSVIDTGAIITKSPLVPYTLLGVPRVVAPESGRLYTKDNGTVHLCLWSGGANVDLAVATGEDAGPSFVQQNQMSIYAGFVCPLYSGISILPRSDRSELGAVPGTTSQTQNTTHHTSATDCNGVTGNFDETVTTTTTQYTHRASYQDSGQANSGDEPTAYLVLSAEDRESVLFIKQLRLRQRSGHWVQVSDGSINLGTGNETQTDYTGNATSSPAVTYDPHSTSGASNSNFTFISVGGSPSADTQVVIDSTNYTNTGEAKVLSGGSVYSHALSFGAAPTFNITNSSMKEFSSKPTSQTSAQAASTFKSMHGNMTVPDAALTPPDQRLNSVRVVDGVYFYEGGFTNLPPDAIVSFIGKS